MPGQQREAEEGHRGVQQQAPLCAEGVPMLLPARGTEHSGRVHTRPNSGLPHGIRGQKRDSQLQKMWIIAGSRFMDVLYFVYFCGHTQAPVVTVSGLCV